MKNTENKKGNAVVGILIIGLLVWGLVFLFSSNNDQSSYDYLGSSSSNKKDCSSLEPSNSYDDGSGHYAGFEWGENGNSCSGNSDSFIEGCEDYEQQEAAYVDCLNKQ